MHLDEYLLQSSLVALQGGGPWRKRTEGPLQFLLVGTQELKVDVDRNENSHVTEETGMRRPTLLTPETLRCCFSVKKEKEGKGEE